MRITPRAAVGWRQTRFAFGACLALSGLFSARAEEEPAPPPPPAGDEEPAPPPSAPDEEPAPPPEKRQPPAELQILSVYTAVPRWRGQMEVTRRSTYFFDNGISHEDRDHDDSASATFILEQSAGDRETWHSVDSRVRGTLDSQKHEWNTHDRTTVKERASYSGPAATGDITLHIHLDRQAGKNTPRWDVFTGGKLSNTYVVDQEVTYVNRPGYVDYTSQETKNYWPHTVVHTPFTGPVKQAGVLTRVEEILKPSRDPTSSTDLIRTKIVLAPLYDDVELEVEITGTSRDGAKVAYDKWVPAGMLSGAAGGRLTVTARLKNPDGKPPRVEVKDFTFRLSDTSREPGVCLNFPLNASPAAGKRSAPDLKFAVAGGTTDAERQEKHLPASTDDKGLPVAETEVECFDWGAWSDLTVTASLADGREITGHLKGDPSAIVMPLPKRRAGSHIADAWKQMHKVTAGDNDDSEKIPCGGKADGDGFTLYEEYRGFAEDGRHIEGDPEKTDFFVRNEIGADARPGIDLFEEITGAVVHQKLRAAEFDRKKRLMNGNHAEGAHRVDQHGAQMQTIAGTDGAVAVFSQSGVRGRPKLCIGIDVQPREAETSVTTSVNVPTSDLVFAYDRAIVHELLHVVGVEHHGTGDGRAGFRFVFWDDPENTTGKSYFSLHSATEPVAVTDETTKRDLALELEGDLTLLREMLRRDFFPGLKADAVKTLADREGYDIKYTADELAEKEFNGYVKMFFSFNWYVGAEHGQCSGDESCVMRYYFAKVYEKRGAANAFYFIRDEHTERALMEFCHSAKGTGINASDRRPQPRYGDAKAGGGNCASWIVFNDAIPPDPAL